MAIVKIGNFLYFIYIFIAIILFTTFYLIFKSKSSKTQKTFLLILAFINLALHFSKLLFEPYRSSLPSSIRKITFENICAISTLVMPFVMLLKRGKMIKNYFFFISFVGGIGAMFYPTEAINKSCLTFDVNRFYFCHMMLCIIPALSGAFSLFKPDYKKFWQIPIMFIIVECIILINEIILIKVGFVTSTKAEFFDRAIRNSSFVFGPMPAFDNLVNTFINIFVPKLFMRNVFHLEGVEVVYWPVVWLIIPSFIYLPIVYEISMLPFTINEIKKDLKGEKLKCIF